MTKPFTPRNEVIFPYGPDYSDIEVFVSSGFLRRYESEWNRRHKRRKRRDFRKAVKMAHKHNLDIYDFL